MGIFKNFKELVGIEEFDEDDLEAEEELQKKKSQSIVPPDNTPEIRTVAPRPMPQAPRVEKEKILNRTSTGTLKMIVIEQLSFEESPKLVDNLKTKKPVIINLENLETDVARKIFDFLSGATYALNGNVQKVANNIFLFAPENVNIDYNMNKKQAEAEGGIKSPWK